MALVLMTDIVLYRGMLGWTGKVMAFSKLLALRSRLFRGRQEEKPTSAPVADVGRC